MWIKRKKVDTMMNTNSKLQKLDEKTKIRAELAAKILTGILPTRNLFSLQS